MNQRHRNAQFAGRESVFLHTITFFTHLFSKKQNNIIKKEVEEDAYVLDVNIEHLYITVMVPRYGIEGKVQLIQYDNNNNNKPINNPKWIIDEQNHKISWYTNKQKEKDGELSYVQVLNKVKVCISISNNNDDDNIRNNRNCELVLSLVNPSLVIDCNTNDDSVNDVANTTATTNTTTTTTNINTNKKNNKRKREK